MCTNTTVIIIGVNPTTLEIVEGRADVVVLEILAGQLQRNVTVTLNTVDATMGNSATSKHAHC